MVSHATSPLGALTAEANSLTCGKKSQPSPNVVGPCLAALF